MESESAVPRILSLSSDKLLLRTREMILAREGYAVRSVSNLSDALRECAANHYDLIIVGHSLQMQDKRAIVAALKDTCGAPVLVLLRGPEERIPEANACVVADDGPRAMLDALRKLL